MAKTPVSIEQRDEADSSWYATQRWQQLDGEQRANVLRILCLAVFYGIHLANYYQLFNFFELAAQPELWFHQGVTALVAAWVMAAFAVFTMLKQRIFPPQFPYVTTGLDVAMLTAMLCMGGGQQSPLVLGFLLVLILAALRFNLTLIRFATVGCLLGYLFVVAAAKWPALLGGRQIGRIPRYGQLMTSAAIAIAGIMLGQLIRRIRTMAQWYAHRAGQGSGDE